jgi:hypothetical protein
MFGSSECSPRARVSTVRWNLEDGVLMALLEGREGKGDGCTLKSGEQLTREYVGKGKNA